MSDEEIASTASPGGTPHPAVLALKREQERRRELETFVSWEDALFENPNISGNHKLAIRATRRAVQRARTHDEKGRVRINLTTIAEKIGVSPDTMSRGLKMLQACGVIADHDLKKEPTEDGEIQKRHYVTLNEEVLARPREIQPPTPRNHGGNRYRCKHCGSDQVKIRRRVTLLCHCCGGETVVESHDHDQEPEEAAAPNAQADATKNFVPPDRNLQDILKPVSPPSMGQVAEDTPAARFDGETSADDLQAAAALLKALAGEDEEHIKMPRDSEAKYLTVHRPLYTSDLLNHLQGKTTRGASCRYHDGRTRGLGWDEDDQNGWQVLERAARQLADAGYFPLLEKSPANRGGHLWVIYDALVNTSAARSHVYSIAPELANLKKEYWPGPQDAPNWNRVRLPGGKYTRPGVDAWCELESVATGEIATDGAGAARLLLTNQTPASIVPAIHDQDELADHGDEESKLLSGGDDQVQALEYSTYSDFKSESRETESQNPQGDEKSKLLSGAVDPRWHERYNTPEGKHLWFGWTHAYVAAWWNERHSVDELLDTDRKGYGLATWRGERTASVAIDKSGQHWTDFGAGARQSNGSPDSGDALELKQRITGVPKTEVMQEAARELLQVARNTLESAARSGQPIPAWLEEIIRDPGRKYYAQVASEAGHLEAAAHMRATISEQDDTSQGGLTGFSPDEEQTSKSKLLPGDGPSKSPGEAVPYEREGWVHEEL